MKPVCTSGTRVDFLGRIHIIAKPGMRGRRDRAGPSSAKQGELPYKSRGGPRKNAGRPKVTDETVPHLTRAPLASRFPVHVTVRLRRGLPRLRKARTYRMLRAKFLAGCERGGFRLVEYSVQNNHIHLLVEAKDRGALSRGVQGLLVRVARGLNKLWERRGKVFAVRYHDRILRTPTEVRRALVYVLQNAKHHGRWLRQGIDGFSSGPWFRGWREPVELTTPEVRPTAEPGTWLLRGGWKRARGGRLAYHEAHA